MSIASIPGDITAVATKLAASPVPRTAPANGTSAPASTDEALPPAREQLEAALKQIQEAISPAARDVLFSIDEDSGRTVVKVVDSATQELIRQIPTKEVLDIARSLDRMQGLLLKQKA